MPQQYVYKLVREDWITGERARRPKTIIRDKPDLRVGGLMSTWEKDIRGASAWYPLPAGKISTFTYSYFSSANRGICSNSSSTL